MDAMWSELSIAQVAELVGGSTPSTKNPDNFGGDIPWITPKDLSNHQFRYIEAGSRNITERGLSSSSAKLLPANSVLLSTRAPVGYVAIAKNPLSTNQGFRSLILKDGFDPEFVYYLLQHNVEYLRSHASGTTFAELSGTTLKSLRFMFPPYPEQRAIARILGTLDDKIEINRKMNTTLESIAQALFQSWFVDFAPIHAKSKGRNPGLSPQIANLFPSEFEDSSLGPIPRGWRVSRIGEEVTTILGGTPSRSKPEYWGGAIPWINSGKANDFRIISPSEFITQEGLDSSSTKLLPPRTIIVAITGATLGQISLTEFETCANQSIAGILGNSKLPSEFIYFWSKARIADLLAWQTGAAQQHINKANVNNLPVLCPGKAVIISYLDQVRPLFDCIKTLSYESLNLATTRDALLPKLLSGGLRAKAAE